MINVLCLPEASVDSWRALQNRKSQFQPTQRQLPPGGLALRELDLPITFLQSRYFENTADLPLGVDPPGPAATTTA
jgi:hypothetical protein